MKSICIKMLALAAVVALPGCALEPAPYYERHFGEAVNTAKARQTINPDAGKNPDPVAGISGTPAVSAMERYEKTFQAPPPTFKVLIGGGVATQ